MTTIVTQIAQSTEVLGTHVQYLSKHPKEFLALTKLNAHLALRYAQAFSAGHVLTLLTEAQACGLKLITDLVNTQPSVVKARQYQERTFPFPANPSALLEWARSIFPDVTGSVEDEYNHEYEEWVERSKLYYKNSYVGRFDGRYDTAIFHNANNMTVQERSNDTVRFIIKVSLYKNDSYTTGISDQILEPLFQATQNYPFKNKWDRDEQNRVVTEEKNLKLEYASIASALLSKLDSSVFFQNKDRERMGVLDAEFEQAPPRSRFFARFTGATNTHDIFTPLIELEQFDLMGKVISLLSPARALRELQKPRSGNQNLMEKFIAEIPTTPKPMEHAIERMGSLPERLFETLMSGFHFDILGQIKAKCENLAKAFYHLAPGFMQRQYPTSVASLIETEKVIFSADLPPPY